MRNTTVLVPPDGDPWPEIWEFALSYDAYDAHGGFEGAARIGNGCVSQWTIDRSLPDDLISARAALFFEQRRFRHFGWDPEGEDARYVRALLSRIRHLSGGRVAVLASNQWVQDEEMSTPEGEGGQGN